MQNIRNDSFSFRLMRTLKKNWQLYVLLIPALLWLITFCYVPIYGILLAFKDYKVQLGITFSPWAGLKYFKQFFTTTIALTTIRNTILLSLYTLLFSFPIPIIFSLLLNQLKNLRFKKFIQTISFAPYFISNVVVVSILTIILAPSSGFVNNIIQMFGGQPQLFMSRPEYFRPVYVISQIWQTMGFNAIIYIAALAGISPDLHEAAIMDGATKWKRILYIDLPCIMPTITIMFILAVGNILTIGYEKVYLMQSGMNLTVSEIISTYVYKAGLINAQYSFSTAVGLFNSVINFIVLITANTISRKMADIGLF